MLAVLTLSTVAGVSAALAVPSAASRDSGRAAGLPADEPSRGMVYKGLRPSRADGPCRGMGYELGRGADAACTHGPDRAPAGIDVRKPRSLVDLAASAVSGESATAATPGAIVCHGDGVSGKRVQAIYARPSNVPGRFSTVAGWIRNTYAPAVEADFNDSAKKTGGTRHVRWVTGSGCVLSVIEVVLSTTGDDDIYKTRNELSAKGFNRADRKYLVWMDSNVYCGIGFINIDDSPLATNRNNGGVAGMIARVDAQCWGRVESHELMHTLGGVQLSAPHSTKYNHCTDEYDRMCYADGSGSGMSYLCPADQNRLFDCRNDDYFHTNPPSGSYLATHWNTANSSFLDGGTLALPPPPSTYTLTVARSGLGAGTVTSLPAGISCGTDCSQAYAAGTVVTLTALPSVGSVFGGWSGGVCVGTAACVVTMSAARTVSAVFSLAGSTAPPSGTVITAGASGFSPASVTVPQGTKVTWSFTAGGHGVKDASGLNVYDSGLRAAGTTYSLTFVAAGHYPFVDPANGSFVGSVLVPASVTPTTGSAGTQYTVKVGTVTAMAPWVYDILIHRPTAGPSEWHMWRQGVLAAVHTYVPDDGLGAYYFAVRVRDTVTGAATKYSPMVKVTVS